MLLLVKVSPEMDQRQTSTHVGRNHLSWDILPFDVLICLPSPLRSFWRVETLVSEVVLYFY